MTTTVTLNTTATHDPDYPHVTRVVIGTRHVMADRASITADAVWSDGQTHAVEFVGNATPGYPGPVDILTGGSGDGIIVTVSDPTRHGDTFNAAWIERYYRDRFTVTD